MTAIAVNDGLTLFERFESNGSSAEAEKLLAYLGKTVSELRDRSNIWNHVEPAMQSLDETYQECGEDGWDGYDASAISESVYEDAKKFLNMLPMWISSPEIVPEPDGDIGLEWRGNDNRMFVASLNGKGSVSYAGIIGREARVNGMETFYDSIPTIIAKSIKRLDK
jgi:hypothetical protein